MKKNLLLFFFFLLSNLLLAQTKITGKVTDKKGAVIPGANVFIKDSYDGTSSDANGHYDFTTTETGNKILSASFLGFETAEQKVELDGTAKTINFPLSEKANELNTVTITAGAFEASDEKKMVILRPLDIVTTAGAAGDIYGALQTLPGLQPTQETEGLFVRGGDSYEAKTFIDGIAVPNPYFSSVPDVPQRGRFSPFLFKGTNFSTGGYSAQYGQALSSALILETEDLPAKTTSAINIMSVGGGAGHTHRWKNSSLGVFAGYINLYPYYKLVNQNRDWDTPPSSFTGSMVFRQKTSETGIVKAFINYQYSDLSINYPDLNDPEGINKTHFALNNYNIFGNISYKEMFGKKWTAFTNLSYSKNLDRIYPESERLVLRTQVLQGRLTVSRSIGELSSIRFGAESLSPDYVFRYNAYSIVTDEPLNAAYAEGDIYITNKLVSRLGIRAEHSDLLKKFNAAPRVSLAYKVGKYEQFSFAYGDFYQSPKIQYEFEHEGELSFERATHYILNFQHVDDKRTFRIEGYYKNYDKLTRTLPDTSNTGTGFARGFDIFWRDKKTFQYVDYWVSYSFLDTKRKYLDYPVSTTPSFAADHVFSIVFKRWFPKINSSLGFTYAFATGRPYYNPNNPDFLSDRTKEYHNLSLTGSYLTMIGKHFTVIAASVGNVLGIENVFTYRYSDDGTRRAAVGPTADRTFFIGVFISIGEDRTDDN